MTANTTVLATFILTFQGSLALSLNQASVRPGETLRVDVTVSNPGPAVVVDVFFGLLLPAARGSALGCPGGETPLAFVTAGGVVLRCLSASPATFPPRGEHATVPAGLPATTISNFFIAVIPGEAPPDNYTLFLVLTPAGALADGLVDPGDIAASATTRFSIVP